jgi:hypothetical protein
MTTDTENNLNNRERLAREVVETFTMDDLVSFVTNSLEINYIESDDDFQEDWLTYMNKFHNGDEVFWTDPDDGLCSGVATFIQSVNEDITIIEKDGLKIEVYTDEIS